MRRRTLDGSWESVFNEENNEDFVFQGGEGHLRQRQQQAQRQGLAAGICPLVGGRPGQLDGSMVNEARELGEALWPMMLCREDLTDQIWECSLGMACLQGWPLAGIWERRFQEGSHHPNRYGCLNVPKLFAHKVWFMLNCILLGAWNFAPYQLEGAHGTSISTNPGHSVSSELAWLANFSCVVTTPCWRNTHLVTPLGEDPCAWFL